MDQLVLGKNLAKKILSYQWLQANAQEKVQHAEAYKERNMALIQLGLQENPFLSWSGSSATAPAVLVRQRKHKL